jgi:hypothetical protein
VTFCNAETHVDGSVGHAGRQVAVDVVMSPSALQNGENKLDCPMSEKGRFSLHRKVCHGGHGA